MVRLESVNTFNWKIGLQLENIVALIQSYVVCVSCCDVILSLWPPLCKMSLLRSVWVIPWCNSESGSEKYLGLLQLHLSVSFFGGVRILMLSLQQTNINYISDFVSSFACPCRATIVIHMLRKSARNCNVFHSQIKNNNIKKAQATLNYILPCSSQFYIQVQVIQATWGRLGDEQKRRPAE